MDALILAGGENIRMPVPKGHLLIQGQPIIERTINIFSNLFRRIFISTNTPELYFYTGAILIGDILPQRGPMTGIFSVLSVPGTNDIFVTACDMPFINVILVSYLVEIWDFKKDALIPVYRNKPEPLFGIYSKRVAGIMEESILKGEGGLQEFLGRVDVRYVAENDVRRRDPEGASFVNINTLEDYQRETGGK